MRDGTSQVRNDVDPVSATNTGDRRLYLEAERRTLLQGQSSRHLEAHKTGHLQTFLRRLI